MSALRAASPAPASPAASASGAGADSDGARAPADAPPRTPAHAPVPAWAGEMEEGDGAPETVFWFDDPCVLADQWYEVVPYGWFSSPRKGNALTRLAVLVGAVLLLNRLQGDGASGFLFVTGTLVASVLAIVLISRRAFVPMAVADGFAPAGGAVLSPRPAHADEPAEDTPAGFYDVNEHQYENTVADVSQDTAAADLEWMAGGTIERSAWGPFDETDTTTTVVEPHAA